MKSRGKTVGLPPDFSHTEREGDLMARPTDYSPELAARICDGVAAGKSLVKICSAAGMPCPSSVYLWLTKHPAFSEAYARAKEDAADVLAEQILDIADIELEADAMGKVDAGLVNQLRLRIDARKWIASKLKPRKYGERIQQEITGKLSLEQILATASTPAEEDRS